MKRTLWLNGLVFLLLSGFSILTSEQVHAEHVDLTNQFSVRQINERMAFSRIDGRHGLPDDEVWSIVEDRLGLMWFGTRYGGLARFDGHEFKRFEHVPNDPGSLVHNFVWTLLVDTSGTLWVGTNGGGLDRYDEKSGRFIHLGYDKDDSSRLPHANVKVLFEDSRGQLWVGTNGGLSRYDRETATFTTLSREPDNPNSLSDNSIRAIAEERGNGRLWLGTRRGGLNVYDPRHKTFMRYQNDPKKPSSLSNDSVEDIFEDRAGTLWIGTRNGLNRFNPNTNDFVRYRHDRNDPKSIAGNWVKKIHQDRKGRLWIGTLSGVDIFNPTDGTFEHVPGTEFGSAKRFMFAINTIFEDKSGALWFGSRAEGVALLNPQMPNFQILSSALEVSGDQPNTKPVISAIDVDAKGHAWIGFQNSGLEYRFGDRVKNFRHAGSEGQGLIDDHITAIATDKRNNLWIGTLSGISKFDGNQFVNFPNVGSSASAVDSDQKNTMNFAGSRITALSADQSGGIWFGVYGNSLNYFDGANIKQFGFEGNGGRTPIPLYPEFILPEEGEAGVWVGTNNMGLGYADMAVGHVKTYLMSPNHPEDSRRNKVRAGSRDSGGLIWLATNSGVYVFDPKEKKYIKNLTVADGLPSNTIMSVLVDKWDKVWIATKNVLSKFDPVDGSIRAFFNRDDLLGAAFLPKIAGKAGNGKLYWGTSEGIFTFLPEKNQFVPQIPQVILTELKVWKKSSPRTERYHRVTRLITNTEKVELEPDQNDFIFKFVAPAFSVPKRFRYSYMLEGYDRVWQEAIGLARSANYSKVPPGSYIFRVRAASPVGEWGESTASVSVTIRPHWWQTTWFQGSLIAVLLSLIAAAFLIQNRVLARFADLAKFPNESPHPVMRFDLNDKLSYSNDASKILFETGAIDPTDNSPKNWLPVLRKVRETGVSQDLVFPVPEKKRHLHLTFSPLQDSKSVNVYGTDITDRVESENALRQSQKLEAIGQLANGIAHDFNNLLTVVVGNLELLADNVRSDEKNGSLINIVVGAVSRGSSLTRRLLNFSLDQPQNVMPIHAGNVVDRMHDLLSRSLGEHVTIEIDCPDDLWHCRVDMSQLETSLLNLAINARDAMPSGGNLIIELENTEVDEKSAKIIERSPGQYVRVSLKDTGCGMTDDILERALEPFFTTKSNRQGSGLGLSMVYSFAKQSQGHLEISSTPDKGTTVVLDLPRSQSPRLSQSVSSAKVAIDSNHKCHFLVVEDDAQVRDLVGRLLRQSGHDVMAATNAVEALGLVESGNQFDVLVSDVVLPNGMNGIELAAILVGREPNLGVLLMSGHMDDATLATINASPSRNFVQKPFRRIEFLQKIDDVIREMV